MRERARRLRLWTGIVIAAALPALTGCGNFFVKPDNSGGGTGGGGTTGNRVYVANTTANTIAGFAIGTATLTAVPGSPLALGYAPSDVVVTPSNSFLYVAGPGAIYVYTINADGSITGASGGAAVAIVNVTSLDVSPDGNWLFGLDGTTTVVDEFKINRSTGALSSVASTPYSVQNAVVVPRAIRVAPSGSLVFAALGTGGDVVFTFNTSTGTLASSQVLAPGSATTSDNALAIDSTSSHLFIARTGTNGGVAVYTIGAAGLLTSINGSPFAAGTQTSSLVLDRTGKYLYAANRGDNTISGYTISASSSLSALNGSPYASGTQVNSLGADKSGKYILAAAIGGSPDLSMYGFDAATPGKLTLVTSATTGTAPTGATALAVTH